MSVMGGGIGLERARIAVLTTHILPAPPGSSVDDATYKAYCYSCDLFCQDE
jgi:hypothetical protein